jgi:N-acetylglucosaminyldiphosphoundecaprenol N-acetyl-beta-D-mannosaminyltransferase
VIAPETLTARSEVLEIRPRGESYAVLGVRVDAVDIPKVITTMEQWIREDDSCHFIAVTGMHGVMEAQHDAGFKAVLNTADLVVPDGMPLVWLSRVHGLALRRRVYGPELMLAFCEQTSANAYRHFFYGGKAGVAEKLAKMLAQRFPGICVAGTYSPPFRPLTAAENEEVVALINAAAADVVWVGLSTPKQERWMSEHRNRLRARVLVGVGAAFDIHSGAARQAPRWMRENGLEWLFRLLQEPRRLWWRYLGYGSEFVFAVLLESLGIKAPFRR